MSDKRSGGEDQRNGPSIHEFGVGDAAWAIAHAAVTEKWSDAKLGPEIAKFALAYKRETLEGQRAPEPRYQGLVMRMREASAWDISQGGISPFLVRSWADELERLAAAEPRARCSIYGCPYTVTEPVADRPAASQGALERGLAKLADSWVNENDDMQSDSADYERGWTDARSLCADQLGAAWRTMAVSQPPQELEGRTAALKQFTEWLVSNYPGPDTTIFDPKWHAPKIFRAVEAAITGKALNRTLQTQHNGL